MVDTLMMEVAHMNHRTLFALGATLLISATSVLAAPQDPGLTEGVIKKLDLASAKVTIAHGEIANLNMPPMTMRFKAETPTLLKPWKEGDKIRFHAEEVKGALIVTRIEAAK